MHKLLGMPELVVEVVRSGFVECVHRVRVHVVDAQGAPVMVRGDTAALASPRSAMKPLQALAMLRHGLPLTGELLALACASHCGEAFHVDGVRKILASAGLDESALRCPPDLPYDEESRLRVIRSGGTAEPIYMNCSGKHAAMLATCAVNGWPLDSYLHPGHPLQRAIRAAVEELTGERIAATGVDGCGAPLLFVSMTGVVRAYRRLVLAEGGPERRIADAMRAHPEWTTGTARPETALMRAIPGLLVKSGAEGFVVWAHSDGRAGAVKVEDGGERARMPATVAALRAAGLDAPELTGLATTPLFGGGEPVGEVRVRPA